MQILRYNVHVISSKYMFSNILRAIKQSCRVRCRGIFQSSQGLFFEEGDWWFIGMHLNIKEERIDKLIQTFSDENENKDRKLKQSLAHLLPSFRSGKLFFPTAWLKWMPVWVASGFMWCIVDDGNCLRRQQQQGVVWIQLMTRGCTQVFWIPKTKHLHSASTFFIVTCSDFS